MLEGMATVGEARGGGMRTGIMGAFMPSRKTSPPLATVRPSTSYRREAWKGGEGKATKTPGVDRGQKAGTNLLRGDALDGPALVEVGWERELQQDAVDSGVATQLGDESLELRLSEGSREGEGLRKKGRGMTEEDEIRQRRERGAGETCGEGWVDWRADLGDRGGNLVRDVRDADLLARLLLHADVGGLERYTETRRVASGEIGPNGAEYRGARHCWLRPPRTESLRSPTMMTSRRTEPPAALIDATSAAMRSRTTLDTSLEDKIRCIVRCRR